MSRLVIVGSGGEPYRRYAMEALAGRYPLSLVLTAPATWQAGYVDAVETVPPEDPGALAEAIQRLIGDDSSAGVLTWDELVLEACAEAASKLHLPSMSPEATAICRDKLATRQRLEEAGLGSARFRHVRSLEGALDAAAELGYPVVLKPRSLAGSAGVVLAHDQADVRVCYATAAGAMYSTLPIRSGLLVEEFLTGPEFSVDALTWAGKTTIVQVTRKEVGFPPYFEEVGHVTGDFSGEQWYDDAAQLAIDANGALGINCGFTHTEIKLTPSGPAVVEVNGRLGGDLIPLLGKLSSGVDQVAAAAAVAMGRTPDLTPTHSVMARVEFVYPDEDCVVDNIDVEAARAVPGVVDVIPLAAPGDVVRLPPRAVLGRFAAILTTGETEEVCAESARLARSALVVQVSPAGPG